MQQTETDETLDRLVELMVTNPRRIFHLPEQPETYIEVDPEATYMLSDENLQTKCGWHPYVGITVTGRVERVILRGQPAYDASYPDASARIVVEPGRGRRWPGDG